MEIREIKDLSEVLVAAHGGWYLSTGPAAVPVTNLLGSHGELVLFVGPEGGWTEEEETAFAAAGVAGVSLGPTVLRVETAAVVAAGFAAMRSVGNNPADPQRNDSVRGK
jgi:RsmE family RNA methyltransferase